METEKEMEMEKRRKGVKSGMFEARKLQKRLL